VAPVLPTERIAHLSTAGDCCAAGFWSCLCAAVANAVSSAVTGCVLILRSPRLALAFFTVSQLGRLGGQLLQPFGQAFELLVCVELVQAVNADLSRLGVVVGDTVDVFGAAHDLLIVAGAFILLVSRQ
jgi:hypothetical protein